MYFKKKSSVIFRDYGLFGYITDNRNFGYSQANNDGKVIGDKIVSQSGAVFLLALGKESQRLDCLAEKISMQFKNADIELIKKDAREFYCLLESDGFVVSGDTLLECNEKDTRSSSITFEQINNTKNCSANKDSSKSTQTFFEEYFNGQSQLTNLHIEISNNCNERCVHCYIPHDNKANYIEANLFYSILDQCKSMNLLHLTLSGGEPMMHSDFIDFLKKCNEYNFSINILSNLTLLNNAIIEEMKRNHLLSVQVSLYAMDSSIHDSITQIKGSFEKTIKAILSLKENDIPLQISCPIMKQNINHYIDVVHWGESNNINVASDYVIIARYNHTIENLSNRLSISEVKEIINQRIINEPKYFELLEMELEKKRYMNPDDSVCSVCHSSICIADNGNVYPCAGWQDYVVGNVNEQSLNDIWLNSKKVQYLRNLRKQDFPQCVQCDKNEFCTMCMVRNANEHPLGDPLAVNEYFCNIAELNRDIFFERKCSLANSLGKC